MTIQTEPEAFWYLPQNRTPQMNDALANIRQHIKPEEMVPGKDDDITLLRFLKARQWNVEKACAMYRNMVAWRKQHKVDELYQSFTFPDHQKLVPHYPHFYHKVDKYGRPVYVVLLGSTDCDEMLKVAKQELILDFHTWTWERLERQLLPACSELKGHPVATCTVILDLHGIKMKNFNATARTLLGAITKIDQDFYPEHLGTMFIINAPMVFTAIWAVVSPMLEERTRKKIMVLGTKYHDTVAQLIPQENLLTIFGGTSVCKDHIHSEGPWTGCPGFHDKRWFPDQPPQPPVTAAGASAVQEATQKLAGVGLQDAASLPSASDMKITAELSPAAVAPAVVAAAQ